MRFSLVSLAAVASLAPAALGHSWIESMMVIDETGVLPLKPSEVPIDGSSTVVGFPRANSLRDQGFDEDKMVHKILAIDDDTRICSESQSKPFQSVNSPILKASPGDMVALLYQENGHVSISPDKSSDGFLPFKAKGSGTVFIYGTTDPKPDDKLTAIWKKWTADGQGGDKRGFLLAARDYDDGQCHQDNTGPIASERRAKQNQEMTLFCQNDITIPDAVKPGSLFTIYWVWQWDNMKAPELVETENVEMYTTCMDIEIVEGKGTSKNLKYADDTDIAMRAIKAQLTNSFTTSNPVEGTTSGEGPKIPILEAERVKPSASPSSSPSIVDVPSSSTQVPDQPKTELKPTTTTAQSTSASAPKASDTKSLAPGEEAEFVPGQVAQVTVTVTEEKSGPTATVTVTEEYFVGVEVGKTFTPGPRPSAPATSLAPSPTTLSTVTTSAASQSSSKAGASAAPPSVQPFMNAESSVITPSTSAPTPTSTSSPSSTDVVATSSTASTPSPAMTSAPVSEASEDLQIITEEATITEFETIVTSFVKPSSTSTSVAPLPTIDAVHGGNGTAAGVTGVKARALPRPLPRFRRLRRAV